MQALYLRKTRGGWQTLWNLRHLFIILSLIFNAQAQPQECAVGTLLSFSDLDPSSNITVQIVDPGNMGPLYNMVQLYLDAVQPNPFPEDLLRKALNNTSSVSSAEVVKYEAGYVFCAIIAVLYLLLMPLAGLIFCICRCRGKCGGRIDPSHKSMTCKRNTLISLLGLTSLIILAGVVCTFTTNQKVTEEMEPGVQTMSLMMQNFRAFLASIPNYLEIIANEFSIPKDKVMADLEDIGHVIGLSVYSNLNQTILPLLVNAEKTAQELENSVDQLKNLNESIWALQQRQEVLNSALADRRQKIIDLIGNSNCMFCDAIRAEAENLVLGSNYSKFPSLETVLNNLEDARGINLTGIFQKGIMYFDDIPALVETQSAAPIANIKNALNKTEGQVHAMAKNFQIEKYTSPLNEALKQVEDKITYYGNEVKNYDRYRWIVGIVLCCILLLIILFTLLGLILGVWWLSTQEDTRTGEIAGILLMIGTGLSFIFSWLLILLVFVTFLPGGNIRTLLCKHWANQNIYKFIDGPGNLPPNMDVSKMLGLQNVSITSIYQECKQGASFFDVLKLDNVFNLEESLNISKYTADLQKNIDNLKVDLGDLSFLTELILYGLESYRDSGLDMTPYAILQAQLQIPLVKTNLVNFAEELETLSAKQADATIQKQLMDEAKALRELQASVVQEQEADVVKLKDSLQFLVAFSSTFQPRVTQTILDIKHIEEELPSEALRILKNETSCFLSKEMGYFSQYVNWVKVMIMQHVASCWPVSITVDNVRVILCDRITDPWNAFWFCLGWCTIFLIPSTIFSIKTVKYFQPLEKRLSR
ncbi:prominin-2 isoform X2 [Microcaecilia unicolor]|uniref:Prominin-2 isoform X2 n=1 Tax=Microcaecilia unicolor TaxID=1415580 RepID=A0A6P7Y398_9AMPH|nr:prominin-2 isoform X2 [Microcaecilia unicolor]